VPTDRRAEVRWQGSLLDGSGTIVSTTTGAIGEQPVSWAARSTDETGGVTSPENCPVSKALAGVPEIGLDARLAS
jgi:lipoyl-dependent peroxiredoxin